MTGPPPLLSVQGLAVEFPHAGGAAVRVVEGVDLEVRAGEVVCLVGESGCGKSVTVRSLFGLLPPPGGKAAGRVVFDGVDLETLAPAARRAICGASVGYVFQDPMTYLNPLLTAGAQVAEALSGRAAFAAATPVGQRVAGLLRDLGIGDPLRVAGSYPHQLSGGMRQRVMIAMAIARRPKLLILDEPTTALDVTVQAQIVELIRTIQKETACGLVFVTHDFGLVAELADRVYVMYAGQVVEHGRAERLFARPQHPYTQGLIQCVIPLDRRAGLLTIGGEVPDPRHPPAGCRFHPRCPRATDVCRAQIPPIARDGADLVRCWHAGGTGPSPAVEVSRHVPQAIAPGSAAGEVKVRGARKEFAARGGAFGGRGKVHAVNDVSFELEAGQIFALVGESGSGKSSLGRLVAGLEKPTAGDIRIGGDDPASRLHANGMLPLAQMVFQDPSSSLNPRKLVQQALAQPLVNHRICRPEETEVLSIRLLELMGLFPGTDFLDRYPHELSGGQRQRVVLARALAAQPRVLVADEPVSSLDMSTRAQILGLIQRLRSETGLSVLLVTHDLAVVSTVADRVGVMYLGRLFEVGQAAAVIASPMHPYTQMLVSAVPLPDPARARARQRMLMAGEPPSPVALPAGCYLHPRCPKAMAICSREVPQWREVARGQHVACHLYA
ncbi:MAG: ABC transporter ATP-binding protein [Alphaproteobacteria bacterium]|nr:ABC transporter ATP-binding protein [Alphaproteobacteria bacterium]